MKLVDISAVDNYVKPLPTVRHVSFSSLSSAEEILKQATYNVIGYLPEAYRGLLYNLESVLIVPIECVLVEPPNKRRFPSPFNCEWVSFVCYEPGDSYTSGDVLIGDQIVDTSFINPDDKTFTRDTPFIISVTLGNDLTGACPSVLKEAILRECFLRMIEVIPEWSSDTHVFSVYQELRAQQHLLLDGIRAGRIKIAEWDELKFALRKAIRRVNQLPIDFGW